MKQQISSFFEGEELYWRCDLDKTETPNPFNHISLCDVSINRQGNPKEPISEPKDVLLNTQCPTDMHYYPDKGIVTLLIKHLIPPNKYKKVYEAPKPDKTGMFSVEMELIHDPLKCMYPHSMFRFKFEGEFVSMENYKMGFGKKPFSSLRMLCKAELSTMIIQRKVSFE